MANLEDIITSKVRVKILELFFSNLTEMYHVRGIVREINEEINAVRRELEKMETSGILKKEPRGNRVYYFLRADYSMFGDLLSIVAKSTGLGKAILDSRSKLGKINLVMFSGKFARSKPRKKEDEVDLLVVGEVVLPELASVVRNFESKLGREINYTVMAKEELEYRKKRRDPFLQGIFLNSRVMIIGDEEELTG
ncbi:MAG: Transcriptional regulator [Candidatus Woesebacteria bacterium GW2011_GWA1_33_30]|uniref:Transcriptional regulator n=1 Tax=Candidatus Woesebacteria bacterium GW2011_GWA2_33_28 TaxID=1618561 RepID=A0A0G0C997_9BACT|nr:MAG: Transcriptional regulator [Candidatus Woesebacteria bacterium GW2011_GWA2_33_28]KKP48617.1 MAG: Transcriptional regulator [Candidatus Woesebacteria bacterium GW2011_GWA1_33_30]KKP49756.1 MAG: Transcriptional regulator [Microgenomates group bacterium GW2011_GWC1_33_32]KKP52373.1 MAG: Transcriptional regulator [Candidatus Woesebacteria bacterium GW2011_GWB1_33_38]KKP57103.1 MAG: Transcriptional regulator [Microgenomates group bacterium GW2011_GWD1_33_9]